MISRLAGERSNHHGSTERRTPQTDFGRHRRGRRDKGKVRRDSGRAGEKGELTVKQGKVLNEELKHNIKDAIRENVTLHVVTPEETCGEENDEEESADDTADFVMDAVDSLNDEQLERRSQSGR